MNKTIEKENIKSNNMFKILKGIILSVLITLLGLLILAIVITYTNVSENVIPMAITIITAISILIGSFFSTINIQKNGLLNGFAVGFAYIATIYIISSITSTGFTLTSTSFIMIISAILAGMLGGIIGVNLKNKK